MQCKARDYLRKLLPYSSNSSEEDNAGQGVEEDNAATSDPLPPPPPLPPAAVRPIKRNKFKPSYLGVHYITDVADKRLYRSIGVQTNIPRTKRCRIRNRAVQTETAFVCDCTEAHTCRKYKESTGTPSPAVGGGGGAQPAASINSRRRFKNRGVQTQPLFVCDISGSILKLPITHPADLPAVPTHQEELTFTTTPDAGDDTNTEPSGVPFNSDSEHTDLARDPQCSPDSTSMDNDKNSFMAVDTNENEYNEQTDDGFKNFIPAGEPFTGDENTVSSSECQVNAIGGFTTRRRMVLGQFASWLPI